MPTKRMLVDATHPEETRIVVTSGNKLEEFDFESASRRQLRGNIYLAKVTRVEPSLQAAFVDYGGNRHGFLAFSEIHPDYYQIPVADREALLEAEAAHVDDDENGEDTPKRSKRRASADGEAAETDGEADDNGNGEEEIVDSVGGDDALEEAQSPKRSNLRRYKIQEVIKRRQVMLVQVVKEERGNKGAALTTYLSLAGRYSVLMPNTARGGGISRKITNAADRKRLKSIAEELEVPQGMGVILRTAGAMRTKAEVKRDFEYLMRLWENVRSLTLESTAPCLVYEEGSLIKRTIRDLYNKDINEVWVAGDGAYREAKDFMRMIMPSHAKNVQQYKEDPPIFSKYNVESQLDSMFSPQVTLPSGGYIVINPTEALVSIDVNSGRSTKEHNIEDTAYQTNLEAADEVARQLRLRDLAGLIVIDFIDMMEKRSIRNVERRLKDALKNDRARIQVGRISHFGLMEMSRQRMRFGVLESSTHICPVCQGAGIVRSVESLALMVMRAVEDHVLRKPGQSINVRVPSDVALYILNAKRDTLSLLEAKCGLSITISSDASLIGSHYHIERGESRAPSVAALPSHVSVDSAEMAELAEVEVEEESEEESKPRSRRRRRGGRRDREASEEQAPQAASQEQVDDAESDEDEETATAASDDDEAPRKRRRRGRRGGRRNRRGNGDGRTTDADALNAVENGHKSTDDDEVKTGVTDLDTLPVDKAEVQEKTATESDATERQSEVPGAMDTTDSAAADHADAASSAEPAEDTKPVKKPRRARRKKSEIEAEKKAKEADKQEEAGIKEASATEVEVAAESSAENVPATEPETAADPEAADEKAASSPDKTDNGRRPRKSLPEEGIVVTSTKPEEAEKEEDDKKPKRSGWWQRGFFG